MKGYFMTVLLMISSMLAQAQSKNSKAKFGDLTSNAKEIDVDVFCSLSNGLCVVTKGDKEALIDVDGNFIVEWGKYKFIGTSLHLDRCDAMRFYNGLVKVRDLKTSKVGFIDRTGNVVIPIKYDGLKVGDFSVANMCYVEDPFTKYLHIAIDVKGKTIFDLSNFQVINEKGGGLNESRPLKYNLYWRTTDDDLYFEDNRNLNRFLVNDFKNCGFINKSGKVVIPLTFQIANQFSEGMASVGKTDEFGVLKWGYIDSTGKLVIPYQFTYMPGPFHSGLALVKPTALAAFNYAYIDKKGNIKIKIGDNPSTAKYYPLTNKLETSDIRGNDYFFKKRGCFLNGITVWQSDYVNGYKPLLLDTAGNFSTFDNFLLSHSYPVDKDMRYILEKVDDKGFYFKADNPLIYEDDTYGLIDFSGKLIYPPVAGRFTPDFFGSYSVGNFVVGKEGVLKRPIYREGIINNEGLFTVIKTEKKELW